MTQLIRGYTSDLSLSAILAGVIATVISYAGPLVIIFQAASGLGRAQVESWIWAISIGSGLLGIILSLRYKVPVVIAWSAPGSALLVSILPTVDFGVAVGAYIAANLIVLLVGATGAFDKIISRLPLPITAAMLAGILFRFAVDMVDAIGAAPLMALAMIVTFFIGRRWSPRFAVAGVLIVGVTIAFLSGHISGTLPPPHITMPVWTMPRFEWLAMANIAIPLAIVALTGQFLPGFVVLRNAGYGRPTGGPVIMASALGSIVLAPFGCHGLNLAAFTAAICLGPEAHHDPDKRYIAGVAGGLTYLLFGMFAASILALFSLLPQPLIATLAGLALFPVIAGSLAGAMQPEKTRDAALITFAVSASGITILGLGAALWGLLFGLTAYFLLTAKTGAKTGAKTEAKSWAKTGKENRPN